MRSLYSHLAWLQVLSQPPDGLARACDLVPQCVGFTPSGWLKSYVKPVEQWRAFVGLPPQYSLVSLLMV